MLGQNCLLHTRLIDKERMKDEEDGLKNQENQEKGEDITQRKYVGQRGREGKEERWNCS